MQHYPLAAVAISLFAAPFLPSSFAQMEGHGMQQANQTGSMIDTSPAVMTTENGTVDVKLSWDPETLDADEPAEFTIEFIDNETGERLTDVAYAVHMSLDGKSIGHGHNGTAPNGTATFEQSFESAGALSVIVEVQQAGGTDLSQVTQFSIAVTPELPMTIVALVIGLAVSMVASGRIGLKRMINGK